MGFKGIVGHEDIIAHFKSSIETGNVAHAYIISGDAGSGKKALAYAFAETLECEAGGTEACGTCKSCLQVSTGNYPDIITVTHEKPNLISVDEVRDQLINTIDIKPYKGKYKIYIIPDAELLNVQAQNAMLKTIEEPPAYAVILLLTTNLDKLLETVKSRCLKLQTKPIRERDVLAYLTNVMGLTKEKAYFCLDFAQGNLGKAIKLAGNDEYAAIVDSVVGVLAHIDEMDVETLGKAVKDIEQFKMSMNDYMDLMMMWYRDAMMLKVTGNVDKILFKNEFSTLKKQAGKLTFKSIEDKIDAIAKAEQRLLANANFEVTIELLLLTLKEEAHYYIQMRCTDKAGNESEKKKIEFIIDKTVPNITIKGVKNEAVYEDRVIMPEVICEDKYLDADSVKVYLLKAGGEPVSKEDWNYERTEDKRKVQIQWENLRQNKSKDGIYQLFIKANDKAGNKIKDNYKVVFRVNRWGADFILNHKIKESIDGHYLREEPNIILKERCVKQTKSRVIILKDNEERRTLKGEYVKECIIADKKSEKYGWYEKSYNIKKENFAEEGEYLVTIQEDSKEKKIHFVIDKTPPAVHISNLEKDIYEEEEHNFTIGIMDNYAFERMELYVEKSTIPLHKKKVQKFIIKPEDLDKNHMVNQKITEDTAYQTIHYIAWDKAGNKLDSNDNGDTRKCLVTTNKPVKEYYKNNPKSQIIMGIVIATTVFTSGCIAFYNRKKHR